MLIKWLFCLLVCFVLWNRISLGSFACSWCYYIDSVGLEFIEIYLLLPPGCCHWMTLDIDAIDDVDDIVLSQCQKWMCLGCIIPFLPQRADLHRRVHLKTSDFLCLSIHGIWYQILTYHLALCRQTLSQASFPPQCVITPKTGSKWFLAYNTAWTNWES